MKIKQMVATLVIAGSLTSPLLAVEWKKVQEDTIKGVIVGVTIPTIFAVTKALLDLFIVPGKEEIDAQNRQSILKTQAIIINNDNSLNSYEQQLAKLRQMCVVYKDEQLCKQCEELDKDRINMILANAYLKSELAKKLRAHQEKEMRAAQQSPLTAKAAPAAK